MFGVFLGLLLLMTTFPHSGVIAGPPPWDKSYSTVVALVADLPGTVVCPEDPTIPLHAKQYVGRSLFAELDAHPVAGAWSRRLPDTILADLRAADFVVEVHNYWDGRLTEAVLKELEFTPVAAGSLNPSHYRIWRRQAAAVARAEPRWALNRRHE